MTIEAMKQALEALESSRVFVTTREKIKHPEGAEWYDERITALRTAIEQAEKQEPVCEVLNERGEVDYISYVPSVGTPLYTAPRKWVGLTDEEINRRKQVDPIRVRIMQEAYDLADRDDSEGYNSVKVMCSEVLSMIDRLLDERQWQGLTKKEFLAAVDGLEDLEDCWVAIEAKLKEKNG